MKKMHMTACLAVAILLPAIQAAAQDKACTSARSIGRDVYEVKIDGAEYIAAPRRQFLECTKQEEDLRGAQAKNEEMNGIIAAKEGTIEQLRKEIDDLAALLAKAEEAVRKWKTAADKCETALRTCLGSSSLSLEFGGGMTDDSKAIGLVGVGLGRFRAWGTFRDGESAAFVGFTLPLLN